MAHVCADDVRIHGALVELTLPKLALVACLAFMRLLELR